MPSERQVSAELQRERDAWRRAALRVGESIAPDGPPGYYAFSPEDWLHWALEALKERRREVER